MTMNSRKKRRDALKASRITWRDVWELPLEYDGCLYAWSQNRVMALTFATDNQPFINTVLHCINNANNNTRFDGEFTVKDDDFFFHDKFVFRVRGWGHLTGCGAMNLPIKEAARIQDEFIAHILHQLNGHVETIVCPKCGKIQEAFVSHTLPFPDYTHKCKSCGYWITESEWEKA